MSQKKKIGRIVIAICVVGALSFGGWLAYGRVTAPSESSEIPPELRQEAPLRPLEVQTEINNAGERVFSVDVGAFIESYNGYYYEDYGERYLRDEAAWQTERQPAGMHFPEETDAFTYCLDFSKWTLPRMTAYASVTDGKLRELVCNYDDHSYSLPTFAMYEEMCAYALRCFLPDMDRETAQSWVTAINKVGDENTFNSDKQYRSAATKPTDLFVHEDVGVFSYVAIGAPLNFCVIPVDSAMLEAYRAAGVRIHTLA